MAVTEESVKLLIEAEDRSRDAFEQAKKRTEDLKKAETDLWKEVARAQNDATVSGKAFQALRTQAMNTGQQLQRSYGTQAAALHNLAAAHTAASAAVTKLGQQTHGALSAAGPAILAYAKSFIGVGIAIETAHRSMVAFGRSERDMTRIALETGKTAHEVEHLGQTFTRLAGLTGRSIEDLNSSFRAFRDQAGTSLGQTEELFEGVTVAAHAAGVEAGALGRIAISTMRDLRMPMNEMYGYLDMLVKNVPASMIGSWGQVAPKITELMRNMGFTGQANAELLTSTFTHLAQTMGSTERAAQGMTSIFSKAQDVGTNLGKMMIPEIERIQKAGGDAGDVAIKMLDRLTRLGADDPNLAKRSMIQKAIGVTPQDIEALKEAAEHTNTLREVAAKTGESIGEVDKRIRALKGDSQTSLDTVGASFNNMLESIGKILNLLGLPNAMAEFLKDTATKLEAIVNAWKYIQDHVPGMGMTKGAAEIGAEPGAPKTAPRPGLLGEIVRPSLDPIPNRVGKWIGRSLLDSFGGAPQGPALPPAERERLDKEEAEKNRRTQEILERRKQEAEARRLRATPSTAPRPGFDANGRRIPGYALGGSFEVGGKEGIDREEVGFMATRGERVDVTTEKDASLQQQQDKADIAMREHFARFHSSAFTKTAAAPWWPGGGARPTGTSGGGGGTGGAPGGTGGAPGGGGDGPNNKSGDDPPNTSTGRVDPRVGYDPRYPGNAPAGQTPSLIGPFGQVMPAWGAEGTDPGGKYWGGGAGGGAAGGVPGMAGGPSGRALTKEERDAAAAGQGGGGGGGAPGTGGAGYLSAQRASFREELRKDPALRAYFAAVVSKEARPGDEATAVAESVMNRAAASGVTLRGALSGKYARFFGPINRGEVRSNANATQYYGPAIDRALDGSNLTDSSTDQGMRNEIKGPFAKKVDREWFGDWGGGKGMARNRAFREKQQQAYNDAQKNNTTVNQPAGTPQLGPGSVAAPGTVPPGSQTTAGIQSEPPAPGGAPAAQGTGTGGSAVSRVHENQNAPGVTRVLPIQARLKEQLEYAAAESGVEVDIFSGGQHAPFRTKSGKMTSHRHDKDAEGKGGAADLKLYVRNPDGTRRTLDSNNPADAKVMEKFTREAVRAGATGVGHGPKYMGSESIHIGGGTETSWGGGPWIGRALAEGKRNRLTPQQLADARAKQKGAPASQTAVADAKPADNKPAAAPTNVAHGAAGGPSGASTKTAAKPPDNKPAAAPTNTKVASAAPVHTEAGDFSEGRAEGGPVRGGREYVVGEYGPEIFTPSGAGDVNPSLRAALEFESRKRAEGGEPNLGASAAGNVGQAGVDDSLLLPVPPVARAVKAGLTGGKTLSGVGGPQDQGDLVQNLNERYGPDRQGANLGGIYDSALSGFRALRDEITKPIQPQVEMPRAGPMRQRMSKRVEQQRERDVGRMTRHASHSDIGFV
jgi:hypothetical protein